MVPADKHEEFFNLRDRVLHGEALTGVPLSQQRRDGTSLAISLCAENGGGRTTGRRHCP
jgi:hypothetical protein